MKALRHLSDLGKFSPVMVIWNDDIDVLKKFIDQRSSHVLHLVYVKKNFY